MFTGSVYIFGTSDNGLMWSETQKIIAYDGDLRDIFGFSVAVFNNIIVVGARGAGDNSGRGGMCVMLILLV